MPEAHPGSVKAKRRGVSLAWYTNLFGREAKADPPILGSYPVFIPNKRSTPESIHGFYTNLIGREPAAEVPIKPSYPEWFPNWSQRKNAVNSSYYTELIGREPQADPPILGIWPDKITDWYKRQGVVNSSFTTNLIGREPDAGPVPQGEFPDFTPKDWTHRLAASLVFYANGTLPESVVIVDPPLHGNWPDKITNWTKVGNQVDSSLLFTNLFGREPDAGPVPQGEFPDYIIKDWSKRFPSALVFYANETLPEPPLLIDPPIHGNWPDWSTDWAKRHNAVISSFNSTNLIGREPDAGPVPQGEFPDFIPQDWARRRLGVRSFTSNGILLESDPPILASYPDYLDGGRKARRISVFSYYTNFFGREGQLAPILASYPDKQKNRTLSPAVIASMYFPPNLSGLAPAIQEILDISDAYGVRLGTPQGISGRVAFTPTAYGSTATIPPADGKRIIRGN